MGARDYEILRAAPRPKGAYLAMRRRPRVLAEPSRDAVIAATEPTPEEVARATGSQETP